MRETFSPRLYRRSFLRACAAVAVILFFMGASCRAELSPEEERTIRTFEDVSPSVVFIKNAALEWDWFSSYIYEIPQGAGSGFIWDKDGHIITNFHVIYQAYRIEVVLSDQQAYPAKVVGISPDHDLAVLKVDAPPEKLKPIRTGISKDLKVGQKIISIGNPFGLDYSLTTGVVSALGRSMRSITGRKIYDVIQTDAAINPGNSGGPVLNSSGELIGVSTAIYSPSGAYAGVAFAIPVDAVKWVVPQLISKGKIERAGLGVVLVSDQYRSRLGLQGALVLEVLPGSAAEKAGLKATRRNFMGEIIYGDLVTSVDDVSVKNNEDLTMILDRGKKAGDEVVIKFLRDGKEYGTKLVLQGI